MRFSGMLPLAALILFAANSALDAGDHHHGFFERMNDRYHRVAEAWRIKWTRCHRAVRNDTYYCPCPPFWMENYGYYPTRWRQLSADAVHPIPDPAEADAQTGRPQLAEPSTHHRQPDGIPTLKPLALPQTEPFPQTDPSGELPSVGGDLQGTSD